MLLDREDLIDRRRTFYNWKKDLEARGSKCVAQDESYIDTCR